MKSDYKDKHSCQSFFSSGKSNLLIPLLSILVFIVSATFFLADIGENSIRYSDEATHVRVIQEMIASKNYLRPTLDGELYLNKPPLKMWLTVAVIKLIGESNFSFRLIDGLCSAAIVAITFLFACEFFLSVHAGLLASLILLGSAGFFYGGRFNTATQDAFVVFANTFAMWCAYLIVKRSQENKNNTLVLMIGFGLALASGVMSKSIVGLVPLIVLAPVFAVHYKLLFQILKTQKSSVVTGAFFAVMPPAIYFAHVLLSFDGAWGKIFGYDIKARLFTEGFHNPEKWWFYLDRLFVQSEFCAAWLLAAGLCFQIFKTIKERSFNQTFLLSWALVPLFIFTCLQSRAFHYIGPAFPAFALVITALVFACYKYLKSEHKGKLFFVKLCVFVLLLTSIGSLGIACAKAVNRLLQNKRKLPIELAAEDLSKLPNPLKVGAIDFNGFLEGDTYQRWRQQFYLDKLERSRKIINNLEELQALIAHSDLDLIFTSWKSGQEIVADKVLGSKVCAYAPLWKPEAKRQSVKPDPAEPEALAILFSGCEKKSHFKTFQAADRFLEFDNSQVSKIYGFDTKEKIGSTYFWKLKSHSASFVLAPDKILNKMPSKIFLQAASASPDRKSEVRVILNGNVLGVVMVAGGKFRNYEFDVAPGIWSTSSNLISIHDLAAIETGESKLKLAGIAIKISR